MEKNQGISPEQAADHEAETSVEKGGSLEDGRKALEHIMDVVGNTPNIPALEEGK